MRAFIFLTKVNFEKNITTFNTKGIFLFNAIIFSFCELNVNVNLINIFNLNLIILLFIITILMSSNNVCYKFFESRLTK